MSSASNEQLYLLLGEVRGDVKSLLAASEGTESRIRALERSKNFILGAAAAVGTGVSVVVGVVIKHF